MKFLLFLIKKKKKKTKGVIKLKKNWKKKKRGQKKQIHRDEVKKKKWISGVSFVDWGSFKTNKRVILFCRKLVSRSKNLNQRKSMSLLEARHLNVEV